MTSTIPALFLSKMRPNALASGREADYFRTLELILEQIQGQVGVFIGEVTDPRIDVLEDDVDTLEIGLAATDSNVSSNSSNIATNTSSIATNSSNIADILDRLFDSVVVVREAADFGVIDSSKTYFIDGIVDMGSTSIEVPPGGLTIGGFGFNISRLISSEENYDMFTGANAGAVFVAGQGVTFTTSGANSRTLAMTNGSGFNAVELNFVNFENCVNVGYLEGYRQLLMDNIGIFGCDDGLEFIGTWIGGARVTTYIVRNVGSSITLFKAGAGLTFGTRFSLTPNIDLPSGTSKIADFAPANFLKDSSFQISGAFITRNGALDIDDANYFPNISESDNESSWLGNTGIKNTVIGGAWECTAEATTTVSAPSTYYKLAGTTTAEGLDHVDLPNDNELRMLTEEPRDMSVIGSIKIEQAVSFGDEINVRLRIFRAVTSTYEERRTVSGSVPNLTSLENVVTLTLIDRVTMNQNDRAELWLSNESSNRNMIMKIGSFFQMRRT